MPAYTKMVKCSFFIHSLREHDFLRRNERKRKDITERNSTYQCIIEII